LVVEATSNAIVVVNADGNIVLVNSQCKTCFGYRREELIGQPVEILIPERYRAQHPKDRVSFFASHLARPMATSRELYGRRQDGSEFPVEIGLTPIQTGAGLLVLSAIVDITERKRAEETRRELAHASRMAIAGELTASIAHEINQPLGAILSNADAAEMLLRSGPESLDEVKQILGDISKDVLRASEVIRRLRGLLSKRELEMQPLDLNAITSEVLTLVRAESLRRGVVLEAELAADLPTVRGDKVHLLQVLLNLVLNGMDAMADIPGPKRLAMRTCLGENGRVEIAVTDAGTGIPPDRIGRVFEPFFSTKKEGMGLGLSIARSLVEAHGGRIWAENNVGVGATFRFTVSGGTPKLDKASAETDKATLELTS
jgi:two-component system, LuxR family, sensor kinase FixL